ncbi:MAG: DUF5458 family protein [Parabacteroides sp.]|nr:DUF5458 family protein [Parabacteroides sp.]
MIQTVLKSNYKLPSNCNKEVIKAMTFFKSDNSEYTIAKMMCNSFEQDEKNPDHVFFDIRLLPFFPAKSFIIKMEGTKGDEGIDWSLESKQE